MTRLTIIPRKGANPLAGATERQSPRIPCVAFIVRRKSQECCACDVVIGDTNMIRWKYRVVFFLVFWSFIILPFLRRHRPVRVNGAIKAWLSLRQKTHWRAYGVAIRFAHNHHFLLFLILDPYTGAITWDFEISIASTLCLLPLRFTTSPCLKLRT